MQEALRCCEASDRVFIWKEKEQKSAAGSGFLVSKGGNVEASVSSTMRRPLLGELWGSREDLGQSPPG